MDDISTARTPFIIAAEINMIRKQAEKAALNSAIEIGRRLAEAKRLVPYGEWNQWLEESVSYTERTAQRFMQVFEAYGEKQPAVREAGAELQGLPDINCTQALVLLAVPAEDRARFIADLDLENMSVRELQKAVKERDKAKQELVRSARENADLRQALNDEKSKNTKLAKERENLKIEGEELRKSKQELARDMERKELETKKLQESSNVKSYQRVSSDLAAAQIKLLTSKVAFKYEALDKAFKELTYELDLLAKIDPHVHGEYIKKLDDFLVKALKERIRN